MAATAKAALSVKYWVLDNEPMLWNSTHRDLHPDPVSYEELWERTVRYAEAIKRVDPTAKVAGSAALGWTDLFFSAERRGRRPLLVSARSSRRHGREPPGRVLVHSTLWRLQKTTTWQDAGRRV